MSIRTILENVTTRGQQRGKTKAEIEADLLKRLELADQTASETTPLITPENYELHQQRERDDIGNAKARLGMETDAAAGFLDRVSNPALDAQTRRDLEFIQGAQEAPYAYRNRQLDGINQRSLAHRESAERMQAAALQAQNTQNIMNMLSAGLITFLA